MSPSRIAHQVGRVLGGRYRLTGPIGSGASGHVFLADDTVLGRRVAVKLLHAALAGDEAFLRRFRAEAQAAAVLNHPHIMGVLDWGEDGDGPFLVLEHLGGGSLADLFDAGHRLTPAQATAVGLEAARALAYAHRRGLVHRDIKPANLLFDEEARLCIADFGLARALAEAAWTEPVGALLGTARYSSPEAVQGRSLDGKADLYALGLVLVEAVTGQVPFAADTTIATLMARVGAELEVPGQLGGLGPVVAQLTRPRPEDRPDASGTVAALEDLARALPPPGPLPLVPSCGRAGGEDPTELGVGPVPLLLVPGPPRPPSGSATPAAALKPASPSRPAPTAAGPGAGATATAGSVPAQATATSPTPGTVASPPLASAEARGGKGEGRRGRRVRGRGWMWVGIVVVVAVLGAGGVMGWRVLAVPSYRVAQLQGLSLARAAALAGRGPDQFRVVRVGSQYDPNEPAGDVVYQSPLAGTMLRRGAPVSVVVSKGPAPRAVPGLAGLDQTVAGERLTAAGLEPRFVGAYSETLAAGQVMSWTPEHGLQAKGTTVTVTISQGPRPRIVPSGLSGDSWGQAEAALQAVGLVASRQDVFSDTVPAGQVVGSEPSGGAPAPRGSTVVVSVSKGPDLVVVPDVRGESVARASADLQAAGLSVGAEYGPGFGPVVYTDPTPGSQVHRGSSVNLYVL